MATQKWLTDALTHRSKIFFWHWLQSSNSKTPGNVWDNADVDRLTELRTTLLTATCLLSLLCYYYYSHSMQQQLTACHSRFLSVKRLLLSGPSLRRRLRALLVLFSAIHMNNHENFSLFTQGQNKTKTKEIQVSPWYRQSAKQSSVSKSVLVEDGVMSEIEGIMLSKVAGLASLSSCFCARVRCRPAASCVSTARHSWLRRLSTACTKLSWNLKQLTEIDNLFTYTSLNIHSFSFEMRMFSP